MQATAAGTAAHTRARAAEQAAERMKVKEGRARETIDSSVNTARRALLREMALLKQNMTQTSKPTWVKEWIDQLDHLASTVPPEFKRVLRNSTPIDPFDRFLAGVVKLQAILEMTHRGVPRTAATDLVNISRELGIIEAFYEDRRERVYSGNATAFRTAMDPYAEALASVSGRRASLPALDEETVNATNATAGSPELMRTRAQDLKRAIGSYVLSAGAVAETSAELRDKLCFF